MAAADARRFRAATAPVTSRTRPRPRRLARAAGAPEADRRPASGRWAAGPMSQVSARSVAAAGDFDEGMRRWIEDVTPSHHSAPRKKYTTRSHCGHLGRADGGEPSCGTGATLPVSQVAVSFSGVDAVILSINPRLTCNDRLLYITDIFDILSFQAARIIKDESVHGSSHRAKRL